MKLTGLGRSLFLGVGIGAVGMTVAALMKPSSKLGAGNANTNNAFQALALLRAGADVKLSAPRFRELESFPASSLALETNSVLLDLCMRMEAYRHNNKEAFAIFVRGAAACALLQYELAVGWKEWTLLTPKHLHACTFEMMSSTRKMRQSIARSNSVYLLDFDEIASEVTAWHTNTISNARLDCRVKMESRKMAV
jgi:hypothetical protein